MKYCLLLGLSMLALTASAQEGDGWKTIFSTEAELKDYPPGRADLDDGLLHVRAPFGLLIPQPGPDGAIRARFHFLERTGFPQLYIRRSGTGDGKSSDYYSIIFLIKTGQTSIKGGQVESRIRGKSKGLGAFLLQEPFELGGHVDMELSVVGDHLKVLVNGKVAFERHDSSIANGGYWGLASQEAWFSNVQVRSFPRGTPAPAKPAKFTDPRITQIEEAYAAAIQREVAPPHVEALKSLHAKYVAALDRALDVATQAGNLDGALVLRAEKKSVENETPPPANGSGVSEPLNSLRLTYHNTRSQIEAQHIQRLQPWHEKFLQALTAYEEELTRAKDLDTALKVRKRRELEAASFKVDP